MEPMEALRYVPYLNKDRWAITYSNSFINIPAYPDEQKIAEDLKRLPHVKALPISSIAKNNHAPRSANMVLRGIVAEAIASYLRPNFTKSSAAYLPAKANVSCKATIKHSVSV